MQSKILAKQCNSIDELESINLLGTLCGKVLIFGNSFVCVACPIRIRHGTRTATVVLIS